MYVFNIMLVLIFNHIYVGKAFLMAR